MKYFISLLFFSSTVIWALPWGHRYAAEQASQNISINMNTSFTVSVEWGEGDWTTSNFGYGTSTDGTGWTWVDLPWFQDGDGSNKRCKTSLSIATAGTYYYAYRMVKNSTTSYSFGSVDWAENSSTLSAVSTIEVVDPLPVELSLFTAIINKNQVTLTWQTTTEVNNYGFEIEKSINNGSWDKIGFVKGAGNSYSKKEYTFSDNLELNLNIRYRLKQIDNDGQFSYSNEIALNEVKTPESFVLSQNYPNPFNPSTVISYQLPVDSKVKLDLFTVNGEKIATLFEGTQSSGTYNYSLSSESVIGYQLTSGVYLYRLQANDFTQTKKLMLMK